MAQNKGLKALGFVGLLGTAAGVFVVCSIIQGIGHSSMFSTTFPDPHNFVLEMAMQLSFYPGWLATGALLLMAFGVLLTGESAKSGGAAPAAAVQQSDPPVAPTADSSFGNPVG